MYYRADPYGIGDQVTYVPHPNHAQPWFPAGGSSAGAPSFMPQLPATTNASNSQTVVNPQQGFDFHRLQDTFEQQGQSVTGRSPCGGTCTIPSQVLQPVAACHEDDLRSFCFIGLESNLIYMVDSRIPYSTVNRRICVPHLPLGDLAVE